MQIEVINVDALNLPESGDVVDWLEANPAATIDDFLALPRNIADAEKSEIPGDLFNDLKARAEALSKDSDNNTVQALLNEMRGLDALSRRTLLWIIKQKTGITLGDLNRARAESGNGQEPDHLELAREVIAGAGVENLLSTTAHVWRWRDSGVWRIIHDREVKQLVQHTMEKQSHDIFRGLIDSVAEVLKTEIFAKEHEWDRDKDAINFPNGELHWTGETWELKEHCREHHRTTQIPHIYDPAAECSRFQQFLEEVFINDQDSAAKTILIFELIGYTLVSNARYEVFILLIGPGANGKSVLLDIIRVLVGAENVAAVQPSQFSKPFQRAHLHLKLANLVTEIAEGAEISDAELKAIVSGELTTAEHKYQPPFDFQPFCTCWFGTNHLPHTRDFSDALFRRAVIIPFNRKFYLSEEEIKLHPNDKADPKLKDKLADEIPGIINIALRAFGEVIKRSAFTEPESCVEAKKEWRIEADQVAQFVGEMCDIIPGAEISSKELYTSYKGWAEAAGVVKKLGRKNFTNRIILLGGKLHKGTGGARMIAGIRLKSPYEQEC